MNLISDIKSLLTGLESNIFLGDKPDDPHALIALYHTGGYNPLIDHGKNATDRPTFQVLVRDLSYSAGLARCEAIKAALNGITNQTINGSFYLSIRQQSDILSLGRDTRNRCEFSINFRTQIQK